MPDFSVQTVGRRVSQWGEGPIWWQETLFYVDIEGHQLVRYDPRTDEETVWSVGERIGTVVPRAAGGGIYAGDMGITAFNLETGQKQSLADPEADKRPANRFNDGKCDPAGRFWAGTISTVKKTGDATLYRLDPDGSLHSMIRDVTNSNGLCWNAAADTLYYIDTPTRTIRAYPFDLATGQLAPPRLAVDTAALGLEGSPDGMAIDAEDQLWVAFCHGGCVVRIDPVTGSIRHRVPLPVVETTACAFGGPELSRLYVTTGVKKGTDEPNAGRLFVIDGLPAPGVPSIPFAG